MAHIIKETRAEVMRDYTIYVILSPFEEKKMYIAKTTSKRLNKVYSDHYNLRVNKTSDLFSKSREVNLMPPMYDLEDGVMFEGEAFKRCVAWTRFFLDQGYVQVTKDILTEYAYDLVEDTEAHYKKIKDKTLEEVLQPEGGRYPNSKKKEKTSKAKQDPLIHFRLDEKDYERVKEAAGELNLSMSAYAKRMTLNGKVITADLSFIQTQLEKYTNSKVLLRDILFSIYTTGNYYPADLANIQKCVDHLTDIHKEILEELAKVMKAIRE